MSTSCYTQDYHAFHPPTCITPLSSVFTALPSPPSYSPRTTPGRNLTIFMRDASHAIVNSTRLCLRWTPSTRNPCRRYFAGLRAGKPKSHTKLALFNDFWRQSGGFPPHDIDLGNWANRRRLLPSHLPRFGHSQAEPSVAQLIHRANV